MKRLPNASAADWLLAGLAPHGDAGPPYIISTCAQLIPPIYDAYAMIFHGIEAEIAPRHEGHSWASWERDQPHEPGTPPLIAMLRDTSTLVRGGGAPQGETRRVLWRELAASLGLRFSPQLSDRELTKGFGGSWPRHFFGPAEGRLDAVQLAALAAILSRHSAAPDVLFRYWWLAAGAFDPALDLVFQGPILDIATLHEEPHLMRCTPSHWFPADRAWCVASDYDCSFTLVGGTRALFADLLAHPVLEALPLRQDEPIFPPRELG